METLLDSVGSNVEFENLCSYIEELFTHNSFILKCPIDKLEEIEAHNFSSFIVHLEDKVVEGNLRMVDTYFPELLFKLTESFEDKNPINDIIVKSKFDDYYLKYKFRHFLEVLLFSDIFHEVFDGKFNYERCYVYKDKELYFFRVHDTQELFSILSDKLILSVVSNQFHNMKISEIRFLFKV